MCGSQKGVTSRVVLIENEIKENFPLKDLSKEEVDHWLKTLKIVLKSQSNILFSLKEDLVKFSNTIQNNSNVESTGTTNSEVDLSPSDIYGTSKIPTKLPYGSFSKNDGVFIPIPSYIMKRINYVKNHWVYVKGQWNEFQWILEWTPILPSFIKQDGDKSKIYYENDGYWIFNHIQGMWTWKKAVKPLFSPDVSYNLEEFVAQLNTIKFGKSDFNSKEIQEEIFKEKMMIQSNVDKFFSQFKETNKMIFAKLKDTVQTEKNHLMSMIQNLKENSKVFSREEEELVNAN
eukprot:CAMPEP_0170519772 /NCGR_PEP_ID=MMETSP0209-20121228/5062_1 /TAXON_ID=665100 ORGANISM="Litonotus pictus, Strain P1" /NCGR_SAMPLE_ID=MMETSP0209 /ASSEMBLY_ACC=CAM_ASM_000301 /LENGTH=287 /DNA_ID=CAMNT_0010805735 /DNA_START=255 /DNA_END=1115 /DNA_ORIENTATION=+